MKKSYAMLLRDVRATFGLTQADMATWLGLSRVQVARVEAEADPLPRRAVGWLLPWVGVAAVRDEAPAAVAAPPRIELPPHTPALVVARVHACSTQAARLYEQLATFEEQGCWRRRRLAVGPTLVAALPPAPAPPAPEAVAMGRRRRWLLRLLEAATDELLPPHPTTGEVVGVLLRVRYAACRHELDLLAQAAVRFQE